MKSSKAWLLLIVGSALFLRLAGINFGLPAVFHQDEPIVVNHAVAFGTGDLNPHFFKIPPLLSHLLFLSYGLLYSAAALFFGVSKDSFLVWYLKDPTVFYLIGRILFGALLGAGSVYLLYRMGRRLYGEVTGLLAAAFLAVCFVHVRDSHYVYVDIPMIFFILLSIHCAIRYSIKGAVKSLWFSTAALGVATALKYIAAPFLLPVFIGYVSRVRRPGEKLSSLEALSAGLIFLGVYAILNPFSLIDFNFFVREVSHQASVEARMPLWHHLRYSLFEGFGPLATLGGTAGALWLAREKRMWAWLALCPFFYYGVITLFSQPYERYAMPIIPFLCLTLAYLVNRLGDRSRERAAGPWVYLVIFTLLSGPTFLKSVELDRLLLKEDTRTLAKQWVLQNIEDRTPVLVDHPFFSPRLEQTDEQLAAKARQVPPADPQAALKIKKIQNLAKARLDSRAYTLYYLEERNSVEKPFLTWTPTLAPKADVLSKAGIRYWVHYREGPEKVSPSQVLGSQAVRVRVFSPYQKPQKIYSEDGWANVALPFLSSELRSRERPGPYLEIYEIT
ncbi:MAG: glycosyltransferase family 39 protein [Candidatus Omnitrophica bacterium]|nr:glycosyltransferase family 39 protein [Candidatus Omnitrophota bacterium]